MRKWPILWFLIASVCTTAQTRMSEAPLPEHLESLVDGRFERQNVLRFQLLFPSTTRLCFPRRLERLTSSKTCRSQPQAFNGLPHYQNQ